MKSTYISNSLKYYLASYLNVLRINLRRAVPSIMKKIIFLEDINIKKVESDPNPYLGKVVNNSLQTNVWFNQFQSNISMNFSGKWPDFWKINKSRWPKIGKKYLKKQYKELTLPYTVICCNKIVMKKRWWCNNINPKIHEIEYIALKQAFIYNKCWNI